jgi:hypothetical protein
MVTHTLYTGICIDYIQGTIALADGLSGAFGNARAASDAFFSNCHCHSNILLCEMSYLN